MPPQVAAHLVLKGLIDPAKEKEKLEKKQAALRQQLDKLNKSTQIKGQLAAFLKIYLWSGASDSFCNDINSFVLIFFSFYFRL